MINEINVHWSINSGSMVKKWAPPVTWNCHFAIEGIGFDIPTYFCALLWFSMLFTLQGYQCFGASQLDVDAFPTVKPCPDAIPHEHRLVQSISDWQKGKPWKTTKWVTNRPGSLPLSVPIVNRLICSWEAEHPNPITYLRSILSMIFHHLF